MSNISIILTQANNDEWTPVYLPIVYSSPVTRRIGKELTGDQPLWTVVTTAVYSVPGNNPSSVVVNSVVRLLVTLCVRDVNITM